MKTAFLFSMICIAAILISACGSAQTTEQATEPPTQSAGTGEPLPTTEQSATSEPLPALTGIPKEKPAPTRVEFQASDGYALVGYFYPSPLPKAPVIVLMHMMDTTQKDWVSSGLVDWLQNWPVSTSASGGLFAPAQESIYPPMPPSVAFNVFTFDYRGYGESGPAIDIASKDLKELQANWLLDSQAAYEKAKTLPGVDSTRMAGIGASIGADGVVYACGEGCLGALSLSPSDFPNTSYKDMVKTLDEAGKSVWCIAHEKDQTAAQICQDSTGAHYNSVLYAAGGGEAGLHGMEFLRPDVAPQLGIGQYIQDFLFAVFNITP